VFHLTVHFTFSHVTVTNFFILIIVQQDATQQSIYYSASSSCLRGILHFQHYCRNILTIPTKPTPETVTRCKNVVFYTRYVEVILLIYNTKHTAPETIQNYIKKIHPSLQFTPTNEQNNRISFLDLLINRHPSKIETDIFRKTTATDTTISFTSNHPTEHKMAAYRQQKIQSIARNKYFPLRLITKLKTQMQHKTQRKLP
jgi:hypothetical protein